jgi:predicted amidohydrolase
MKYKTFFDEILDFYDKLLWLESNRTYFKNQNIYPRSRKCHLYGENYLSHPDSCDVSYFDIDTDTDTQVRVGLFICFDINYDGGFLIKH